ncbi:MAG TPA: NrsF family protein [Candidatus Sulfopaludibacter sp.]|jgi:hypothetical protein|nr:NrsF family protein [Candidatus Sulfopaludibacter sp.]
MTCLEMDAALFGDELSADARQHLASCPRCAALVNAFSGQAPSGFEAASLAATRHRILDDLAPVRPMAPEGLYASIFLFIAACMATVAALLKGVRGLPVLSGLQAAVIFGLILVLLLVASFAVALDMRPGARGIRSTWLVIAALAGMEVVFLALFHDYDAGRFLHSGLGCFSLGASCAAVTALLACIPLRRGYVVAPVSTGAAIGALAGLAGLAALELHCPILKVPHIVIWHGGVLAASIAVGALIGKFQKGRRSQPRSAIR